MIQEDGCKFTKTGDDASMMTGFNHRCTPPGYKSEMAMLRVLFIGLVLLLDLTWSKIAPGVEV